MLEPEIIAEASQEQYGLLLNDFASSGSEGGANVTVEGASYSQLRIRDLEAEL